MNKVDEYAKAQKEAKKNWRRFKETGKAKFQEKADFQYGRRDALGMQLANPETKITNTTVSIGSNNKVSKSKKLSISSKIKNKSNKK